MLLARTEAIPQVGQPCMYGRRVSTCKSPIVGTMLGWKFYSKCHLLGINSRPHSGSLGAASYILRCVPFWPDTILSLKFDKPRKEIQWRLWVFSEGPQNLEWGPRRRTFPAADEPSTILTAPSHPAHNRAQGCYKGLLQFLHYTTTERLGRQVGKTPGRSLGAVFPPRFITGALTTETGFGCICDGLTI